jgi:hypothetical protein
VIAGDDEQIDDVLPPRFLLASGEIGSPFVQPFGKRERRGTRGTAVTHDSLYPPKSDVDLIVWVPKTRSAPH